MRVESMNKFSNLVSRIIVFTFIIIFLFTLCRSESYDNTIWSSTETSDNIELTYCPKHEYNKTCCEPDEFHCSDGHCVPQNKICDQKFDCPDNSDEDGCLNLPCEDRVHLKCEQKCLNVDSSIRNASRCTCYKGFALKKTLLGQSCQDINECEIGTHWCAQNCVNQNGTFECTCKEGFQKDKDDPSLCKAVDKNIHVLYSSDAWIYTYSVENHDVKPVVHAGRVDEMDIDPATNMVYWSTKHRVGRSFLPGAKDGAVTIGHPQAIGPSSIWHIKNSLAIDWTARNLYWISVDILNIDKYQILVSKLDGRYVKTLVDDVMFATSLVVDPEHGKMFWTCAGEKAEIGTAWMNGMYRRTLLPLVLSTNPIALTLDHMSAGRVLYWSDTKNHGIYSVYSDGTRPNKIIQLRASQQPLMMDVFENNLYWVTKDTKQLVKLDKFGRGEVKPLVEKLINQTAIKVYHPRRVDVNIRQASLHCRSQCSHLCLHVPRGYSCSCPDGSRLLLLHGEIHCNTEKEEELDEPLVCDCTAKATVCNTSLPQNRCYCPKLVCSNGVTQASDYEDTTEAVTSSNSIDEDHSFPQGYSSWTRVIIFSVCVIPVLICLGLSFFKRPQLNDTGVSDMSSSFVGYSNEDSSVTEGFAQGGPTIVKGEIWGQVRNNGNNSLNEEPKPDFTSSTQLLVP